MFDINKIGICVKGWFCLGEASSWVSNIEWCHTVPGLDIHTWLQLLVFVSLQCVHASYSMCSQKCACLHIYASFGCLFVQTQTLTSSSLEFSVYTGECVCVQPIHRNDKNKRGGRTIKKCSHGRAVSSMVPSICLVAAVKLMRWVSEGSLVEAEVSQEPELPARLLCCEAVDQGLLQLQYGTAPWHDLAHSTSICHTWTHNLAKADFHHCMCGPLVRSMYPGTYCRTWRLESNTYTHIIHYSF